MNDRPAPLAVAVGNHRVAVGARLRQARLGAGLRLADVAEGVVSVGYLSMIEQGQRTPAPGILNQLAAKVGVEVDLLRQDSDESLKLQGVLQLHEAAWSYLEGDMDRAFQVAHELSLEPGPMQMDARWVVAHALLEDRNVGEALDTVLDLLRDPSFHTLPHWRSAAQLLTGSVLLHVGDDAVATAQLAEAVDNLGAQSHDSLLRPFALLFLARARLRTGDVPGAMRAVDELEPMVAEARTLRSLMNSARTWWAQRANRIEQGDLISAVRFSERAIGLASEVWRADMQVLMLLEIIAYRLRYGSPADEAACSARMQRLRAWLTAEDSGAVISGVLLTCAQMAQERGDATAVFSLCDEMEALTNNPDQAWVNMLRAQAALIDGKLTQAGKHADVVKQFVSEDWHDVIRSEQLVEPWEVLALTYRAVGRLEDAWACMRLAMRGAGAVATWTRVSATSAELRLDPRSSVTQRTADQDNRRK